MRERRLIAGLLDKLVELLEKRTDEQYEHLSGEEKRRTEREIESVCKQIGRCLSQAFQGKTPSGEQRRILEMDS